MDSGAGFCCLINKTGHSNQMRVITDHNTNGIAEL